MPQFFLAASAERDSIAIVQDGRMFLEIVDVCQVQQDAAVAGKKMVISQFFLPVGEFPFCQEFFIEKMETEDASLSVGDIDITDIPDIHGLFCFVLPDQCVQQALLIDLMHDFVHDAEKPFR